jgi:hypothetical protein
MSKGIDETLEVFDYCYSVVNDLCKGKNASGSLSVSGLIQAIAGNASEAMKAYIGSSSIDDELKDLSDEEIKVLAAKGIDLAKRLLDLVKP